MQDRRIAARLLCADLVDVEWQEAQGGMRRTVANLEDISQSGACLQVDDPIPLKATVRINYTGGELIGRIRYCVYREIGYFIGVEFEPDSCWSLDDFAPRHLFDPRRLAVESAVNDDPRASNLN